MGEVLADLGVRGHSNNIEDSNYLFLGGEIAIVSLTSFSVTIIQGTIVDHSAGFYQTFPQMLLLRSK